MRGRGAFTLSVFNVVLTSVGGVVSVVVHVLLYVQLTRVCDESQHGEGGFRIT